MAASGVRVWGGDRGGGGAEGASALADGSGSVVEVGEATRLCLRLTVEGYAAEARRTPGWFSVDDADEDVRCL